MQTVKYQGVRIHVGCEGAVVKGVCLKCGEKMPSRLARLFGEEPLIEKPRKFDAEDYKKRIREGRDLK